MRLERLYLLLGHGKDKAACLDDSRCKWVYSDEECKNPTGYSSSYNGIFAGAMIVGAMIGSIYAGQFAARFGHKVSFLIVGIVGVVSSVMYMCPRQRMSFGCCALVVY
ncbi:hypothetical protein TcBrA4_0072010 [Trypanosoma cruzi]|nr:hypothetical protein TcBrA4_0072010 [Trypanosoma cruzi]